MMSRKPAIFLDRDGVIIEEIGYLSDPDQIVLIPGSAEAIIRLNQHHIPIIVVTNQAGVARGYYHESQVEVVHSRLNELLAEQGASVTTYYYCPHHPTAGLGAYLINCECRKPQPGMLLAAAKEHCLDLTRSYIVGDKLSDIEAGINVKAKGILVRTGYGASEMQVLSTNQLSSPLLFVDNLWQAVDLCLPHFLANGPNDL